MMFSNDNDYNTVIYYTPVRYIEDMADANYVYRSIELGLFFKHKTQIEFVMNLIFNQSYSIYPDTEELKLLVNRGTQLIKGATSDYNNDKSCVEGVKTSLTRILNGHVNSNIIANAKEQAYDAQHAVTMSESRMQVTKFKLLYRTGLLGLLKPMVKFMMDTEGTKLPIGLLNQIPSAALPSEAYSTSSNSISVLASHRYAMEEVSDFIKAVNNIYQACTPPKDKYEMNNGGRFRYKHALHYYSENGKSLRDTTTLKNYVEAMTLVDLKREKKELMLNKSI